MEGQDASVDTEQRILTQNFYIPVLEVECLVGGYDREVHVRNIYDREVG